MELNISYTVGESLWRSLSFNLPPFFTSNDHKKEVSVIILNFRWMTADFIQRRILRFSQRPPASVGVKKIYLQTVIISQHNWSSLKLTLFKIRFGHNFLRMFDYGLTVKTDFHNLEFYDIIFIIRKNSCKNNSYFGGVR